MFKQVTNCSRCAVTLPVDGESLLQFISFSFSVYVCVCVAVTHCLCCRVYGYVQQVCKFDQQKIRYMRLIGAGHWSWSIS